MHNDILPPQKKNAWAAFFLTLLFPGLGHFYLGLKRKAFIFSVMGAGIVYFYFLAASFLSRMAILFVVPFVLIPAMRDAVAIARGQKQSITGEESRIYIIWMLCCVGPFAMPLLWQNKKFSFVIKIILTAFIFSIVFFFIFAVKSLGQSYDEITQAINIANPH